MVLTIIPYNGIQYWGGTGGGTALKLTVKVPNLLTSKVAEGSFGFIPKVLKIEFQGEPKIADSFNGMVELWGRFSIQLLNSKSLAGIAIHFVPLTRYRYMFVGYSSLLHQTLPELAGRILNVTPAATFSTESSITDTVSV